MRKRIKNLITKLMNQDDLYTNCSPRISHAEIDEIEKLGLVIQTEAMHGAESGSPRVVYALHLDQFRERAKKILEEIKE